MEEKLLKFEDGVYKVFFADPATPNVPTSVVRVDTGATVDGKLWATILFEGLPA